MPLSAGPEAHPNGGPSRAERAVRGITPRRRRDVLAAWSAKRGRRSTRRRTPWKQRSQNSAPTHWAKRFARARSCRPAWAARPCSDAQVVYPLAAPANEQIRPMKLRTARLVPRRPAPVSSPRWPEPRIGPGWLPSPIAAILLFGDKNLFPRVITPGESCRLAAPETETALWRLFRYRRA